MATTMATVRMMNRGGVIRTVTFHGWVGAPKGTLKSCFWVSFGKMQPLQQVSGSNGHAKKPVEDWKMVPEDQKLLQEMADKDGRRYSLTPRSTGRKRRPRVPKVDKRQQGLF